MSHTASATSSTVAPSGTAARVVGFGVILWAIGPIMVRLGAPYGMMSPSFSIALFALTVPVVWRTLHLVRRVAGPSMGIVEAISLCLAPAVLLDSVVLTWVPSLYTGVASEQRATAGWLLWFIGTSLVLAFWQASRQRVGANH